MSEKIEYVVSKLNGLVFPQNGYLTDDVWVPCDKDGNPLGGKNELTELELLREEAKDLGIKGWNNAKRVTLIESIYRKKAELKAKAEEAVEKERIKKLDELQEANKVSKKKSKKK